MYKAEFRSVLEYIRICKNRIFGNCSTGDKICYISSIYMYTSGLWAYFLIRKNLFIDSGTLDCPVSLMLSSSMYNHFGPFILPKLINKDSWNKLEKNDYRDFASLNGYINAFNRIAINKSAIDSVITMFSDKKFDNLVESSGKVWIFNKFLRLLSESKSLYSDISNRNNLLQLIISIESLLYYLPVEEWEVPYDYLRSLSMVCMDIKDECIRERVLYVLFLFIKNKENVKKVFYMEKEGFERLFGVSSHGLSYSTDFNIFEFTRDVLKDFSLLKLLYTDFDDCRIFSNTSQLQDSIIKLLNSSIDGEIPIMENKYLINYELKKFIDNNKLPIQFTLFYTSLKDFLIPLHTFGFKQTFLKGIIESIKSVNCLVACRLVFYGENAIIHSHKYYHNSCIMIPTSLIMTIFNVSIIRKLLTYNKNFLLPFILSETIL